MLPDFQPNRQSAGAADGTKSTPPCAACGAEAVVQWRRQNAADPMHTDTVYACGPHAIEMAAAANIHQVTCTAPDPAHVPACNCDPVAQPLDPNPEGLTVTLATGWVVAAPTTP